MTPYYTNEGLEIYHGDARDVLAELDPLGADLVLTDPPYGQQFAGRGVATQGANIRADGARQGVRIVRTVLFDVLAGGHSNATAHWLIFCHWESWPDFYDAVAPLLPIKNALVWFKDRGGMGDTDMEYARDYEIVLYAAAGRRAIVGKRLGAVLDGFAPCSADRIHPVQKPVPLLRHLIRRHAPEGGLVLDPFMGSGSTLEAAKREGRRAIGIDVEERWCNAAAERIAQGELWGPDPVAPVEASPDAVNGSLLAILEPSEVLDDLAGLALEDP